MASSAGGVASESAPEESYTSAMPKSRPRIAKVRINITTVDHITVTQTCPFIKIWISAMIGELIC